MDDLSANWPIKPINSICQMGREDHFLSLSVFTLSVKVSSFWSTLMKLMIGKMKAEKVGRWIHPTITSFWSLFLSTWSALVSERYHIRVPDSFFSILKGLFHCFPFCKIGLICAQEDSRIVYSRTNTCCHMSCNKISSEVPVQCQLQQQNENIHISKIDDKHLGARMLQ